MAFVTNAGTYRAALLAACSLLVSCNGYAPLLTCRDPCEPSYLTRDSFCVCRDYRGVGQGWAPPTPEGKPGFEWRWEEANGCSLNRRYYLVNQSKKRLLVTVSWRIPNSLDRDSREYAIAGSVSDYRDGIDLGYEEVPVPGNACFDRDFMISGWREPHHSSTEEFGAAQLADQRELFERRRQSVLARLLGVQVVALGATPVKPSSTMGPAYVQFHMDAKPEITVKKQSVQDCQAVCDGNDSLRCPIKGFPPDQEKLKSVRDRLRQSTSKPEYSAADIYTIFGLTKDSCSREDVKAAGVKVFNKGQYCAFPMFLREQDKDPAISVHFPESVRGRKVSGSDAGGIAFSDGVSQPTLIFRDQELHHDFGGIVTDAIASDRGVYYQTTNTCIFLGVR